MNRRDALLALGTIPLLVRAEEKSPITIRVNKTPTCGCCGIWVTHLQKAGFQTQVQDFDDLTPIKERLGVPASLSSCHTAEVDGYFIEGHVPAADIRKLLSERPKAKGLTVPGMPAGSPGMEVPSGRVDPYEVLLVNKDGSTSVFTSYGS
jgi:hypothetical protein